MAALVGIEIETKATSENAIDVELSLVVVRVNIALLAVSWPRDQLGGCDFFRVDRVKDRKLTTFIQANVVEQEEGDESDRSNGNQEEFNVTRTKWTA